MCKIGVFTDIWLLILTSDSSLFSTPVNYLKNNAHHSVYSIQLVPETRCRPCICFCTVWWDLLLHAVSSPCVVFIEDCKGVINESCVLITANSLRGTFKGLQRGWRETEPHCPPCGNYKLGLHGSYSFFFWGDSRLKTVQLTIPSDLLAQWEVLPATGHQLAM